jgi:ketosteroid isomerase-like protein
MHPNAQLIERFYSAFQKRDGAAMAACYAPDVTFTDPVFPGLEGPRAGGMWRMLCERAKDLRVEFSNVQADDATGSAHWEAWYPFSRTGRPVHNVIEARFRFRDGLIIEHTDAFDFWRWSRQALGPTGVLLGWTPMIQGAVRKKAAEGLDEFLAKT